MAHSWTTNDHNGSGGSGGGSGGGSDGGADNKTNNSWQEGQGCKKDKSALMISLALHLKEKLDDTFESMRNEMEQDNLWNRSPPSGTGLSWEQWIRNMFLKLYLFLHLAHEGAVLSYQWAYL